MDIKLKNINKNAVLKYLQYRGSKIPDEYEDMIEDFINILKENIEGKYAYKVFDREDNALKSICIGESVKDLLNTSSKVILLAVTLGLDVEKHIRKLSYVDMSKSLVLDAVASAGVESLANDLNEMLAKIYSPMFLTDRFSPGYGDMPITVQRDFLTLLDGKRKIGLGTSSSGILEPRKSITALIGVSHIKQKHRHRGCEECRLFLECDYIKRGSTCGYEE